VRGGRGKGQQHSDHEKGGLEELCVGVDEDHPVCKTIKKEGKRGSGEKRMRGNISPRSEEKK